MKNYKLQFKIQNYVFRFPFKVKMLEARIFASFLILHFSF